MVLEFCGIYYNRGTLFRYVSQYCGDNRIEVWGGFFPLFEFCFVFCCDGRNLEKCLIVKREIKLLFYYSAFTDCVKVKVFTPQKFYLQLIPLQEMAVICHLRYTEIQYHETFDSSELCALVLFNASISVPIKMGSKGEFNFHAESHDISLGMQNLIQMQFSRVINETLRIVCTLCSIYHSYLLEVKTIGTYVGKWQSGQQ